MSGAKAGPGLDGDRLKEALKTVLKNEGRTYADVAEVLGLSLPTVKRILGPEELPLSRLLKICSWLKVSLGELEALAGLQAKENRESLTLEQEEFFVRHPEFLSYLAALHGGDRPDKIATEHGLNAKSTELYLLRLERMGFLTRDAKGRVHLQHRDFPAVLPNGPVIRAQYRSLIEKGADFFKRQISKAIATSEESPRGVLSMGQMMTKISEKSVKEWVRRYHELVRELDQQAQLEQKMGTPADEKYFVMIHMHTALEPQDPEVEGLKSTLGRIVNLEKAPR